MPNPHHPEHLAEWSDEQVDAYAESMKSSTSDDPEIRRAREHIVREQLIRRVGRKTG